MYSKIFASMYDGTIVDAGWEAIVTFQQLIILSDPEGMVDMTAEAISRRTTIPLQILQKGLAILSLPDPNSRSPAAEGRRIMLINEGRPWGWQIVNFKTYRDMKSQSDRREYMRLYMREYREEEANSKHALAGVAPVSEVKTRRRKKQTHTHTQEEPPNPQGGTRLIAVPDEFNQLRQVYPDRAGDQNWRRALHACQARIAEGHSWNDILDGAERYARYIEQTGKLGTEYVKQAATFCGPDKPFLNPWIPPPSKAESRTATNLAGITEWLNGSHS